MHVHGNPWLSREPASLFHDVIFSIANPLSFLKTGIVSPRCFGGHCGMIDGLFLKKDDGGSGMQILNMTFGGNDPCPVPKDSHCGLTMLVKKQHGG